MDYEKMRLAIEVRKLAETLYLAEKAAQNKTAKSDLDILRWNAAHSGMSFVPAALAQIDQIAAMIDQPRP